jgi:hypothetical protein
VTSIVLASLSIVSPASAQSARFTTQQLQEDIQIARQALEEAHGGMYRYSPKSVIDRNFNKAQQQLNTPTDALGFYRILQPTVASIACGHTTSLLPVSIKESLKQELLLPLDVKVLNGHVFIFRDFASNGKLAGKEILRINGVAIARILQTMTNAKHGDGHIPTMRAVKVGRTFKQSLYTLMDMHGSFQMRLLDSKSGHKESLTLAGQSFEKLEQASLEQYPQDQDSPLYLTYSFLDEGKIARIKIYNFDDSEADEDGASMLQTVFEAIQAKGSKLWCWIYGITVVAKMR